jgi:hypothetical protein
VFARFPFQGSEQPVQAIGTLIFIGEKMTSLV